MRDRKNEERVPKVLEDGTGCKTERERERKRGREE